MAITFMVNEKTVIIQGDLEKWNLLKILRDHLGLKGAKCGCKTGDCGTCSVIVDGELTRSCLILGKSLEGKSIKTIEFYEEEKIRLLQEAFVRNGAVQCGFCTPGMIMAGRAILEKNPTPTKKEIREGLKYNLCRCTGYKKIVEAIYDASGQENVGNHQIAVKSTGSVGVSAPVLDAQQKARGTLEYTGDMVFNNLLHGKILFPPGAHGYVKSMNLEKAARMEGVRAIVTCMDDEPWNKEFNCHMKWPYEELVRNQRIFNRHYRYDGDMLAAVAADSEEIAKAAIAAIEYEYETYPVIVEMLDALEPGGYPIHEEGNIAGRLGYGIGNVDEAFAHSEITFEKTYRTQKQSHGMMEPHVAVANFDGDRLTLYDPTQNIFGFRGLMAEIFDLPYNKVKVVKTPAGGAFGAKSEIVNEQVAALLAIKTKGTVRVELSRKEEFLCGKTRTAMDMAVRLGVTKGRLTTYGTNAIMDRGAYFGSSEDLAWAWMEKSYKIYNCENVDTNSVMVYTNTQHAGAVRGYGTPQVTFSRESAINEMCRENGIDKYRFRMDNLFEDGAKDLNNGVPMTSVHVKECLRQAVELAGHTTYHWQEGDWLYGVGMAVGLHGNGLKDPVVDYATSQLKCNPDGSIIVNSNVHELGQGTLRMAQKIAAESLGIPEELVAVMNPDTDASYFSNGAYATRETWVNGGSILAATEELKSLLISEAADIHGLKPDALNYQDGIIHNGQGKRITDIGEIVRYRQQHLPYKEISAMVHFSNPTVPGSYMANVAITRVNRKTGELKIDKLIAVHDVGKAINPMQLEGQIEGGIHMGLGLAISEDLTYDGKTGRTEAISFKKYRMLRAEDMPEIIIRTVDIPDPIGPFGAKGIGEAALTAVAPAVVDGINEAIGSTFSKLPVTEGDIKAHLGLV